MAVGSLDVLRTTVAFTLGDGTIVQNIFHHQRHGIGIVSNALHVAALKARLDLGYTEVENMVKNDVIPDLASVDLVEFIEGAWQVTENIGTFTSDFTGTGTGDMLPNQSSAFITFKTERPKSVGRKFLLPFEEAWQAGSFLEGGAITDMVACADEWLENVTVDAPLDYLVPGIVRTGYDVFLDFYVGVITNVLGTQRRRRPGVGA